MSKQQSLMRGIQINNFFENHISLNGRKINNQIETLIQAHRPKPLIINHQKAQGQQCTNINKLVLLSEKSPTEKKNSIKLQKKRKRIISSIASHKNIKIGVNEFTTTKNENIQKLRQKDSSNKKEKQTSNKKKRKIISPSKLKKQNYPSPLRQNTSEQESQQYENGEINNQNTASNKKIKPFTKLEERFGRSKSTIIKPLNKNKTLDFKQNTNLKSGQKNTKSIKNIIQRQKKRQIKASKSKQATKQNKEKQTKLLSQRKSFKAIIIPKEKSSMTSARQTKVSSAREQKKTKRKTIFHQTQKIKRPRGLKSQFENKNQKDKQKISQENFKARIEDFTEMLTHLKARKSFKKEFQFIQKKINNIVSNNQSEELNQDQQQSEENQNNINQSQAVSKSGETQKIDLEAEEYNENQSVRRIFVEEIQKELLGNQQINLLTKFEEKKVQQYIQNNNTEQDHIKKHQHLNSNHSITHFHNPILERKVHIQKNLENYDQQYNSIKSYSKEDESETTLINNRQKAKQIQCLKRFKLQSNKMMEKIKSKQQKKLKEEELNQSKDSSQQNNKRILYDQKYPLVQSPKFNEIELNSILVIKERYVNDKHNKMSQLVDKMFEKNIVSPKSYETQMFYLGRMQQEDNNILQNFKKQAQHLTSMIKQIKKDKEQIKGIDELIRDEKWEQALQLIKKYEPTPKIQCKIQKQQKLQKKIEEISNKKDQQQELKQIQIEQEQIINYLPEQEGQDSNKLIKLISIPSNNQFNEELPDLPQSQSNIVIKIDQDSSKPAQPKQVRGFQSNLYFIKEYCIALCEYIKENASKLQEFKKNISNPLQFKLPSLLCSYRTTVDGLPCQSYSSFSNQLQYPYVKRKWTSEAISTKVFQQFNFSYDKLKCNRVQDCSAIDRILQGIFIKSIYEALNESLNYERPGSTHGKALPWMNQGKHLKNYRYQNIQSLAKKQFTNQLQTIDQIFGVAIARVIQWGSCICGFIPDTLDLQNTQIDEEYVIHLRQTRMALLLQKMLLEEQGQLQNTQMFQTQVLLATGQKVFREMIEQAEKQFRIISIRSTIRSVDY